MKELDELMKALEERKIPKKLKMTVAVTAPMIKGQTPEETQKIIDECVQVTLYRKFDEDEELGELFMHYAVEVGMEALLKELNIKPEESEESKVPEDIKKLFNFLRNL